MPKKKYTEYQLKLVEDVTGSTSETGEGDGPYDKYSETTEYHDIKYFVYEGKFGETSHPLDPIQTPYGISVGFKPKKNQNIIAVVVHYRDGGTFGHTSGNICFAYLGHNLKEAEEALKQVQDGTMVKEYGYSCPWTGYFSRLEGAEIRIIPVVFKE